MRDLIKSFLVTMAIFGITALVWGVAWYAAQHPRWAIDVLMPILGGLFILAIWGVVHTVTKTYR